jgi:hypothetical protein
MDLNRNRNFCHGLSCCGNCKKGGTADLGTKQTPGRIQVRDGYASGWSVFTNSAPIFEMKNSKATLKAAPKGKDMETVLQAAQKCPTNAIDTHPAE